MMSRTAVVLCLCATGIASPASISHDPQAVKILNRAIDTATQAREYRARGNSFSIAVDKDAKKRVSRWDQTVAWRAPDNYWVRGIEMDGPRGSLALVDGKNMYSFSLTEPKFIVREKMRELPGAADGTQPKVWTVLNDQAVNMKACLDAGSKVALLGREPIHGELCDVIECRLPIDEKRWAAARAADPTLAARGYSRYVVSISSDNLVRRESFATEIPGVSSEYSETVLTAASLSQPADLFLYERYSQEVKQLIPDKPAPRLISQLLEPGDTLPGVAAVRADGRPLRWEDFLGRVLVVETFTSWCYFCKEAMPYYERMRQQLKEQNVAFVALDFDEDKSKYDGWLEKNRALYGFIFARAEVDERNWKEAMQEFRAGLPAFYVVGRDGRIVAGYNGYTYKRGEEDPRLIEALRKSGVRL